MKEEMKETYNASLLLDVRERGELSGLGVESEASRNENKPIGLDRLA